MGLEEEIIVDGILGVVIQIEVDPFTGASGSAGLGDEMRRCQGIVEIEGLCRDFQTLTPDGPASLKFVKRQVDPGIVEGLERSLDTEPIDPFRQLLRCDPSPV